MKVIQSRFARKRTGGTLGEIRRRRRSIGFHDVDPRAAPREFGGQQIAGDGGAGDQDARAGQIVSRQGFEQSFGDILVRPCTSTLR